jgi:ABC-2 type transport system permease protein
MFATLFRKYRYSLILLRQLVITDFKLRYQGSWLGYLWSLLRPLAFFVILYIVFVKFLKTGGNIPYFPVYLLLGIVIWNYFAEVTNLSVGSIVSRGDLIRKINFPKYVIVLAGSFSALINLGINLLVVLAFMFFTGADPSWNAVLFAPLIIAELFIFSIAIAFFLSAVYVRLRDIGYIWEVFMQGAFYITPILYALSFIPDKTIQQFMLINPMAQMIQDLRHVLITPQTPTIGSVFENEAVRLVPLAVTMLIAIVAAYHFRKRSRHFAEDV